MAATKYNKISFNIKNGSTLLNNHFFALSSQGNIICYKQERKPTALYGR